MSKASHESAGIEAAVQPDYTQMAVGLIRAAKESVRRSVNLAMVYAYFEIGRIIVEQEQGSKDRAKYGERVIKNLAERLTEEFGKGFSEANLKLMRRFFLVFSNDGIGETMFVQFDPENRLPQTTTGRKFFLSWSHYLRLMRIRNPEERHFYEIEAIRNDWSLFELERQYSSSLFERLLLSKDADERSRLSEEGEVLEKPADAIRDPYVLEFLDLKEEAAYSEDELENRIIDHLQEFLLELGRGFAFVGRQERFSFAEDHFRVDLVFYNRLLRCFVLFDLKMGKITHQDLGQMQMYVNYYDRMVKLPEEGPTIGIIMCKCKNEAVVEMTLPEDNKQVFASAYETVLPSKDELSRLLEEA